MVEKKAKVKAKIKNKNRSTFFDKKTKLPPLEKRTDKYGKLLFKSKKIIDLMNRL